MRVATWNVNSIRARLPVVLDWLAEARPDIALLQEIKCANDGFPRLEFEALGYNIALAGQKNFNGVAILAKRPIEDVRAGLPGGLEDAQARYIEGFVDGVRVASLYCPNGNPAPGEKFDYKLAWYDRLYDHVRTLLGYDEAFVLGGDYNVCPTDADVYDPEGWADDALCRPEARRAWRAVVHLGLTEAFRALHPNDSAYSFWDYQRRAWEADHGLGIDHLLLSPQAADRLDAAGIDRSPRARPKASDHTPVWCELKA